jgi:hypothetical protein
MHRAGRRTEHGQRLARAGEGARALIAEPKGEASDAGKQVFC